VPNGTWTYTGDPNSSPKDAVRFYLGDTQELNPELWDEEIYFLLSEEGDVVIRAAARGASALVAKYAKVVDKRVDRLDLKSSDKFEHYKELATYLWGRVSSTGLGVPMPYAGGISRTDKQSYVDDSDLTNPFFTRLVHDMRPPVTVDPRYSSSYWDA